MSEPDEHKLNRDISRQARAQALLDNELLKEAFADLEAKYIAAWRVTGALETVARERIWQAIQVLGKVRDHLGKIVADGKLAQREIDDLQAKRKRFGII